MACEAASASPANPVSFFTSMDECLEMSGEYPFDAVRKHNLGKKNIASSIFSQVKLIRRGHARPEQKNGPVNITDPLT